MKNFKVKLNLRMLEKPAGTNATDNKELVIGVVLRDFVALKRVGGQTLQMDVMAFLADQQSTNVHYSQVNNFSEVLTLSATLEFM